MRVLLVEDDESIREVVKLMLETQAPIPNLVIETAGDGIEAIEKFTAQDIDLVLLDLTLPDEHGFEVFKRFSTLERGRKIPVVAVTGHNQKELEKEALMMGFAGYVTKPFDFDQTLFPLMKKLLSDCRPPRVC